MVELLIVILIISILAALVVPVVNRAIFLALQAACKTNVKGIVVGMKQYSSTSEEMPMVPVGGNNKDWNVSIGTNFRKSPFPLTPGGQAPSAVSRNHSANMWLLAREEHVALQSFVCPASGGRASEYAKPTDYWDFPRGDNVSYGMQSPYGHGGSLTVIVPSGVVLVADGSPYTTITGAINRQAKIVNWAADERYEGEHQWFGNSPNHEREGQNAGYIDGSVEWRLGANCGKNGDNIYTATNKTAVREEQSTSPGGGLVAGVKNNENDTLILP